MRPGCGWYDGDMLRYIRDMVHHHAINPFYVSVINSEYPTGKVTFKFSRHCALVLSFVKYVSEYCLKWDWDMAEKWQA